MEATAMQVSHTLIPGAILDDAVAMHFGNSVIRCLILYHLHDYSCHQRQMKQRFVKG